MSRSKRQTLDNTEIRLTDASAHQACDQFSKRRFWHKVKHQGSRAGRSLLQYAFKLYCAALDKDTPSKARWTVYLALGYFIWPIDLVPDFLPGLGYSDDLGVLVWAVTQIARHIKPEHHQRATQWIERLWSDHNGQKTSNDWSRDK